MTNLTPEQRAELRQVARGAFPQEEWATWEDLKDGGFVHVGNARGVIPDGEIATAEDAEPNPVAQVYTPELAKHIATFDPPTILALLDHITQLERERDELRGWREKVLEQVRDTTNLDHTGMLHSEQIPDLDFGQLIDKLKRERDEARAEVESITSQWRATGRAEADAHRRANKAEAALERVKALHRIDPYTEGLRTTRCVCEERWPCSTIEAIHDETGGQDA